MIRATKVIPAGEWSSLNIDTVELDFDARYRRRLTLKGLRGFEFLLDLPDAVQLRNGDGLVLEDGRIVLVKAKREPLVEITASGPAELARSRGTSAIGTCRCRCWPTSCASAAIM